MKTALKLSLITWLWLFVINIGTYGINDTTARLQMAHAWWTGTEEATLPADYKPTSRLELLGVIGEGGKVYLPYDIGQSILMLPGDWVGTQLWQMFPQFGEKFWRRLTVNFLIFMPLNVAVVVSCFKFLKLFDFEERIAGLASIVWLLSTTVLHYAQEPQQNNQILLFVTLGYATALASALRKNTLFVVLSGLASSAALLIRSSSVLSTGQKL
jgi:hypothetical protein